MPYLPDRVGVTSERRRHERDLHSVEDRGFLLRHELSLDGALGELLFDLSLCIDVGHPENLRGVIDRVPSDEEVENGRPLRLDEAKRGRNRFDVFKNEFVTVGHWPTVTKYVTFRQVLAD
jgi:hypothetical protein